MKDAETEEIHRENDLLREILEAVKADTVVVEVQE